MCYSRSCMRKPEEFDRLIDLEYSSKLMLDYWSDCKNGNTEFLVTAIYPIDDDKLMGLIEAKTDLNPLDKLDYPHKNYYVNRAPWWPSGKCVMLTEDNLCSLHALGLKPEQGRQACCKPETTCHTNEHYKELWDTDYGRSVVEKWKQLVGFTD